MSSRDFGRRVKASRSLVGMTQQQLAELIGASSVAISNWENNTAQPNVSMLRALCQTLNVSPVFLLGLDEHDETTHK